MMNRNSSKDSLIGIGARNLQSNGIHNVPRTGLFSHRRAMSFTSTTEDFNSNSNSNRNNVDLFSRNRRSHSVASTDESDLQVRLGRLLAGSTKPAKNELDDLISSNEEGKHDYDWLLTPPGTPSDGKESQPKSVAPRPTSSVRSGSTIQNSRLSASQSDSYYSSKPARSSSSTRSAISNAHYTNRNPNILNTSSASVSSYIRPSTQNNRSPSATRPSTPRAATPSRTRPSSTTTTTRPSQNSRPSTPTSPAIRPASRPSTPSRRSPTSSTSSPSAGRVLSSNGRSAGPTSRPSSPGPRVRPPPQPIIPPDFPIETPPNLRTTLPERPLSAGRSRPGSAMTVKGHVETTNSRRQPSPIVTRGRLAEPPAAARGHLQSQQRTLHVPESLTRKPIKMSNADQGGIGTGFGRNISKKSLDMAIKHMDIRSGGIRPLSRSALFPQSIRPSGPGSKNASSFSCKIMEVDIYESSRYDSILLKEDLKNTSWLHSAEEKSGELCPLFDNGFETLPEPFAPLS